MGNDEEKLVEEMAKKAYESSMTNEPRTWVTAIPTIKHCYISEAIDMLSVVKLHPEVVAMVCPECLGKGHAIVSRHDKALCGWVERSIPCNTCLQHGVVARKD